MSVLTNEFLSTLPRGPLVQHIGQIHTILVYKNTHADPNAFAIAEHSLRAIAVYTQEDEREEFYRRSMAEERRRTEQLLPSPSTNLLASFKKAFEDFGNAVVRVRAQQDPEAMSKRRYQRRIEDERRLGLAFVKAEATRVRKELGLDE